LAFIGFAVEVRAEERLMPSLTSVKNGIRKSKKSCSGRRKSSEHEVLAGRMADTADWVLVLDGSKELPYHSQTLCALSSVLAGKLYAQHREDGKVAVPFARGLDVAVAFLQWSYRQKPTFTPQLAKELA
jgi:hypothetical protein